MKTIFYPIGTIHSPFKKIDNMPIQPSGAAGIKGTIEIDDQHIDGLKDLAGFSHIILIYHFHKTKVSELIVTPFLDGGKRGIFSTRAPTRPNPIGLSVVKLLKIKHNILTIENIDVLDATPLLDIKPYVPAFDSPTSVHAGWLEKNKDKAKYVKSDTRFLGN
ncbi:MAG: tRNA (N6-threonylcarbamoyladenosine(37)-N6)-methyltransferase TrmO [Desulfatitalea sp.]|nr:tRNA (N6-threonylcarbamoyladenosine(37)-N6)-methyltransferase TrmO [Desulfatitalea sp.]